MKESERFFNGMYEDSVRKLSLFGVDPMKFFDRKYAAWL